MRIKKDRAIRSFLKSSKASGMNFTTQPDALSNLANHIRISSREFDKLFKRVSVETITLANAEMRRKLGNYLDEMESMLIPEPVVRGQHGEFSCSVLLKGTYRSVRLDYACMCGYFQLSVGYWFNVWSN